MGVVIKEFSFYNVIVGLWDDLNTKPLLKKQYHYFLLNFEMFLLYQPKTVTDIVNLWVIGKALSSGAGE